ncbi:gag-pol polyprotein [Trichonephila clavipes]|nr:gag-pol polyprotein [Trichonephila clavipes]
MEIPDRHPIPQLTDCTHILHDTKIFSSIDLIRAYQQIPVHEADIPKTAITTPFGLFEFSFMTYGLRNVARDFQRFINTVLSGLDFLFCYLDEIFIVFPGENVQKNLYEYCFRDLMKIYFASTLLNVYLVPEVYTPNVHHPLLLGTPPCHYEVTNRT